MATLESVFTVIGVTTTFLVALKAAWFLLKGLICFNLSGMFSLSYDLKKAGAWAVVTGCTDGIGKAYVEELAVRGLNIVLISRTQSKLDDQAKDIESRFKVKTKVIVADFTRSDIYDRIHKELAGLDIGTLVNNVGMAYYGPFCYGELDNRNEFILNMINCNVTSVAMMTSVVLPDMVAKKRGVIINISSAAGNRPVPYLTMYSATKSFVDFFSRALQYEYGPKGITVQSVLPSFVSTKMNKMTPSMLVPTPEYYVSSAINTLGLQSRTFGCWSHYVKAAVRSVVPLSVIARLMLYNHEKYLLRMKATKTE